MPITRCLHMMINAKCRQKSKTLKTWIKTVREDLIHLEINDGFWKDCVAWRGIYHVVDPDNVENELS